MARKIIRNYRLGVTVQAPPHRSITLQIFPPSGYFAPSRVWSPNLVGEFLIECIECAPFLERVVSCVDASHFNQERRIDLGCITGISPINLTFSQAVPQPRARAELYEIARRLPLEQSERMRSLLLDAGILDPGVHAGLLPPHAELSVLRLVFIGDLSQTPAMLQPEFDALVDDIPLSNTSRERLEELSVAVDYHLHRRDADAEIIDYAETTDGHLDARRCACGTLMDGERHPPPVHPMCDYAKRESRP